MKEFPASFMYNSQLKGILNRAEKTPVKIVTGSSRYGERKPLVIMSEERYLELVAAKSEIYDT